tara:strand:+ start:125 stop:355 length:231 start_codon:yes stop_codon:yes gene_type:complete
MKKVFLTVFQILFIVQIFAQEAWVKKSNQKGENTNALLKDQKIAKYHTFKFDANQLKEELKNAPKRNISLKNKKVL